MGRVIGSAKVAYHVSLIVSDAANVADAAPSTVYTLSLPPHSLSLSPSTLPLLWRGLFTHAPPQSHTYSHAPHLLADLAYVDWALFRPTQPLTATFASLHTPLLNNPSLQAKKALFRSFCRPYLRK